MDELIFANPEYFWFLVLIPLMVVWYFWRYKKRYPKLRLPGANILAKHSASVRTILFKSLFFFRLISLTLIFIALARPQYSDVEKQVETEGIDIVLSVDVSSSMLAKDFDPDRITAAKQVASDFIFARKTDRIGLVVFAGEAFTQSPLTIDHSILQKLLKDVHIGVLKDGTAIGSGLGVAVNRLKDSESSSKVIILLTDGVNNSGEMDPRTAAELAQTFGIRVYTIGVGKMGKALVPVGRYSNGDFYYDYMDVEIDEELLLEIAEKTGGNYFRATNNTDLKAVYAEIDQLEKSRVLVSTLPRYSEEFFWWVAVAGMLLLLEIIMRNSVLRSIT